MTSPRENGKGSSTASSEKFNSAIISSSSQKRLYTSTLEDRASSDSYAPRRKAGRFFRSRMSVRYSVRNERGSRDSVSTLYCEKSSATVSHGSPVENPACASLLHCIGVREGSRLFALSPDCLAAPSLTSAPWSATSCMPSSSP